MSKRCGLARSSSCRCASDQRSFACDETRTDPTPDPAGRHQRRHVHRNRTILTALLIVAAALLAPAIAQAAIPSGSWVWYYQPVQPTDAAKFAGARAVVVGNQPNDSDAVAMIHGQGALAFHYLNVFWMPLGRQYNGFDLGDHPDWQFCSAGNTPEVGRTTNANGVDTIWTYPDLNEQGVHDAIMANLIQLKADGYDGVFFDRGTVALGVGPMPTQTSSCTEYPVTPGATFADAYAQIVKDAAGMGLHIVLNYTTSVPLRQDLSPIVDRVMQEIAPHTDATGFSSAFARRRAEEAASGSGPPRYVEEIKTTGLDSRNEAFFEWAEAGLWNIDITVNAGDNGCTGVPADTICWHYGTFPELTAVNRGRALNANPISRSCEPHHSMNCLWIRRWQGAIVMVNETAHTLTTTVSTGHQRCRIITNVWRGRTIKDNACLTKISIKIPPYAGRIYTETTRINT